MKGKRCGLQLKSYIHTPKPQIQVMESRRGRLSVRTLPCDCREKRRIKGVWMCLGEKLERRERGSAQKTAKNLFFLLQNEGSGCIYRLKLTLRLLVATVCVPGRVWLTLVVSSFSNFLALTLITYLKVFPKHIGLILVSLESSGCLVSRTLMKLKIQQPDQKLWPQELC